MQPRGKTLKLTAVSALVVLTLTGFSTGRGHGRGHGDDGGGGCSSSSQNHDSSTSGGGSHREDDYDSDYDYDGGYGSGSDSGSNSGSGSGGSSSLQDGTVELVSCASKSVAYAIVSVTNPNATAATFEVSVRFYGKAGARVTSAEEQVRVPGDDSVTARIKVPGGLATAAKVTRCDFVPTAPVTP